MASSSLVPQIKYDVFVSFRGTDTRRGFLSHLNKALLRKKIDVYIDDRLERGDQISPALLRAIEESQISLIIFSADYAASSWCLEELVKIIECKERGGQIVIPVFYSIDPSHVRHQKGTYADAFAKHDNKSEKNMVKVQNWRFALEKAANLSGFHSSNFENDAELIEEVVKCVSIRLNNLQQVNLKSLVGIGKPIADLESLLSQGSADVRVVGIWGMGGIGKTTLATVIFNRLCFEYEGYCFMANIREESKRFGITHLKNKMFSILLEERDLHIGTPSGVPPYVMRMLARKNFLVVLDDVNSLEQLETLVGARDLFGPGSRIIVTTRDKQLLDKVDEIYEVNALNSLEALQLFNLHAFEQICLDINYNELSKMVVNYAKGIPLVLKVLGLFLYGKSKEEWESQLEKLKKMPCPKVQDVMRLSYDELDREEQNIFLDIACFFKGLDLEVSCIKILLDACGYSTAIGLQCLRDKALVTISKENTVSMHDVIQEMGWEIVRQESIEDPGKRSRLWDPNDIYQVLTNNMGTEAVKSITMDLSKTTELWLRPQVFDKMTKLQFLNFYSHGCEEIMPLYLPQGLESLPNELRYLHWKCCPLKSLPMTFYAEKLVMLEMPNSQVKRLWYGVQNLVNLKKVNLNSSKHLIELPNFGNASNLEEVDLGSCGRLHNIHPSLFSLHKLVKLILNWCKALTRLQSDVHSRSPCYFSVYGCSRLKQFAVTSRNMTELDLGWTAINELPSSIECLSQLERLCLAGSQVESLPINIKHLSRLQRLDMRDCSRLRSLPLLELPPSLEELDASNCTSLETVLFASTSTAATQLLKKDNKRHIIFANCPKLDEHSLRTVALNAQVNLKESAYEQLPSIQGEDDEDGMIEVVFQGSKANALEVVYQGSKVPEWFMCRTPDREELMYFADKTTTIAINISCPLNEELWGFIFCVIVPPTPSCDYYEHNSWELFMQTKSGRFYIPLEVSIQATGFNSDHVCLFYSQSCCSWINNHMRSGKISFQIQSRIIRNSAYHHDLVPIKAFGVCPVYFGSESDKFTQQMELGNTSTKRCRWDIDDLELIGAAALVKLKKAKQNKITQEEVQDMPGQEQLANEVMAKIRNANGENWVGWMGRRSTGQFTVGSAALVHQEIGHAIFPWKVLWDWRGPQRMKVHMWKVAHDRLLMSSHRNRLTGGCPDCSHCFETSETTLHVMRDCPKASSTWLPLVSPGKLSEFYSDNLEDWLMKNLEGNFGWMDGSTNWLDIFMTACWLLWSWRNKELFEEDFVRPEQPAKVVLEYAGSIFLATEGMNQVIGLQHSTTRVIGWCRPPVGWIKLNTDGVSKGNHGSSACGGVFRNNDGTWIKGFIYHAGHCSAFTAELQGILKGLKLAWSSGFRNVLVESGSASIVSFLRSVKAYDQSMIENSLMDRIRKRIIRDWRLRFSHTRRGGNACADWLANWSLGLDLGFQQVIHPPRDLLHLINVDISETSIPQPIRSVM